MVETSLAPLGRPEFRLAPVGPSLREIYEARTGRKADPGKDGIAPSHQFTLERFVQLLDRPQIPVNGQLYSVRAHDELSLLNMVEVKVCRKRDTFVSIYDELKILLVEPLPPMWWVSVRKERWLRRWVPRELRWWESRCWTPGVLLYAYREALPQVYRLEDKHKPKDEEPSNEVFDVGHWLKHWGEHLKIAPLDLMVTPLCYIEGMVKAKNDKDTIYDNPTREEFLSLFSGQ